MISFPHACGGGPNAYLGGWVQDGFACLDVSYNISDLHEAMQIAREAKQDAVWDVKNFAEIFTNEYWRKYDEGK